MSKDFAFSLLLAILGLGRVDELYQAKASSETDDRSEVSLCLFASQGDPFEALEPAEALFDASASLVEGFCEEGWPVLFVGLVRDHGSNAPFLSPPRGSPCWHSLYRTRQRAALCRVRYRAGFRNGAHRKPRRRSGRSR